VDWDLTLFGAVCGRREDCGTGVAMRRREGGGVAMVGTGVAMRRHDGGGELRIGTGAADRLEAYDEEMRY
jgi:hypothetical protein